MKPLVAIPAASRSWVRPRAVREALRRSPIEFILPPSFSLPKQKLLTILTVIGAGGTVAALPTVAFLGIWEGRGRNATSTHAAQCDRRFRARDRRHHAGLAIAAHSRT